MATKRDYYEVLGVSREATTEEITTKFRKLAMASHPDRNPGDKEAAERFREISEAYDVLRDAEKRQLYDQYGHAGLQGVPMPDFGNSDVVSSLFEDLFSFFGGGGRRQRGQRKGRDIEVDVELTLQEAALGVTKTIGVPRPQSCQGCDGTGIGGGGEKKTCQHCGGSGQIIQGVSIFRVQQGCPVCRQRGFVITRPCGDCRGHGKVLVEEDLEVEFPPGVDNGMSRVVQGAGEPEPSGGVAGDLHVVIKVLPHHFFERHGDDLVCRIPVTFSQAALGATIEIPTVEGKLIKQALPKGTQSHDVVTIPRQGIPNVHGGRRGNLLVQVVVETPRTLTKRQEELLRELAKLDDANVTPERKSWFEKIKGFFGDAPTTSSSKKTH